MAITDRYVITSDAGHSVECLDYRGKTHRDYCIADCFDERRAKHGHDVACTCGHAAEEHSTHGCAGSECRCMWNGQGKAVAK